MVLARTIGFVRLAHDPGHNRRSGSVLAYSGTVEWRDVAWYLALSAAACVVGTWVVFLVWHVKGRWRIRRAGPARLVAIRHRIWREPAPGDSADLRFGPGGADSVPTPPFRFVEEPFTGSQPCIAVRGENSWCATR